MGDMASLVQVKKYFGYDTALAFNTEWKALSPEAQNEIRIVLQNEITSGRWKE